MAYHIKGLKTFTGLEGGGYEFTLYEDKKKIAVVCDDASGGGVHFWWIGTEARLKFDKFIEQQYPDVKFEANGWWAARQADIRVNVDKLIRICSRKILYIKTDGVYTIPRDKSTTLPVYAALLLKKYGVGNVTLVNVLSTDEKRDVLGKFIEQEMDEQADEDVQVH